MNRFAAQCLLAFAVSTALIGCGGSDPEPALPDPAPQAAAPAPMAIQPKVAGGGAPQPRPAMQPKAPAALKSESQQPVENGYVIVTESPQFEIVGREPDAAAADLFAVDLPAAGLDSTSFAVTLPEVERAAAARRGNFQLPEGFEAVPQAGFSEEGMPLRIRSTKDDGEMVLVPAGPFHMGRNGTAGPASPEITVHLEPYYIDVHEVTLAQFQAYSEAIRETKKRLRPEPVNFKSPPDFPALGLPWGEARAFAHWTGKELPTEAQWEKAARGPESFTHPWGNGRAIWPQHRAVGDVTAVKSYRTDVSPFGVYDMAGNAREWCLDWFSDRAFQEAGPAGTTLRNWDGPRSPSSPNLRVVKGGAADWAVWHRSGLSMRETPTDLGFRCVLTIKPPKTEKTAAR